MLPPPAHRPDSSLWDLSGYQEPDDRYHVSTARLVLNIKSQGHWATFLAPESVGDCLLRPGILASFRRPARDWLDLLPRNAHAGAERCLHGLPQADGPLAVPLPFGTGIICIDYDARQALGLQVSMRSAALDSTWEVSATHPRYGWARQQLLAGHLPELLEMEPSAPPGARDAACLQRIVIPAPPPDVRNALAFVSLETGVDVTHQGWLAPLRVPGWTIVADNDRPLAAFQALAGCLHPGELAAWESWASRHWPHVAAQARHACLDRRLPAASPAPRPGRL